MIIKSIQKIIKVGTSKAVTLPARDLKALGADVNDELEITARLVNKKSVPNNYEIVDTARSILEKYKKDFNNLAKR